MKTQNRIAQNDKLRQRLKKLFKKGQQNFDASVCQTDLKPNHIQKDSMAAKNNFAPEGGIPKKRKRNLEKKESTSKVESTPKSKKLKVNPKKASSLKPNNSHEKSKLNHQDNRAKCTKLSNRTETSKKTITQNNKGNVFLSLVQHNGCPSGIKLENHDYNSFFDDKDLTFEDDYDYGDYYDSYSDDYSDDSDDYFEESDSYGYNDSEYCNSESDFKYVSESLSETDPDYELPQNIPEDLVIHKGTAQKREIRKDDDVTFDSENEDPQIFELIGESSTKLIKQPKAYANNELHKLNERSVFSKSIHIKKDSEERHEHEMDCPSLVPILEEDGFRLYNPESDDSSYEELSEDSSSAESDINEKYMDVGQSCDEDCERCNRKKHRKSFINVGIIEVQNCIPPHISNTIVSTKKTEIDKPISEFLSAKEVPSNLDGDALISVSVCEAPSAPDIIKELVTSRNENSVDEPVLEGRFPNGNITQSPQSVDEELIDDEGSKVFLRTSEIIKDGITNEPEICVPSNIQFQDRMIIPQEQISFRTLFFNAVNSNLVIVLVKDPFYFYGTVCMTILAGKVEIYGYSPHQKEEVEIFSPRGCSSVHVSTIPSAVYPDELGSILKPLQLSFSSSDLERIEKDFESGRDAVLLLQRNTRRRKLKNMFKKYMNENVFPNMNSIHTDRPLYSSEYLLDCVINTETERPLRVPEEWRNLYFTSTSKVIITGGKSVGKSTLLRYLLNSQLEHCERVLVIDLDIGQAELFIPQTVSCTVLSRPLLGPGFFLNHQPTRAYAVGHSNIVLCAQEYVRAVRKLVQFCYSNKEFAEIPWLVNTMGYNKGFGMELMSVLSQLIKPTDIVQLQSNRDINNFDELLYPHVLSGLPRIIYTQDVLSEEINKPALEYRLHVLGSAIIQESRYQRDWEMSAKDLRYATFLSRLSDVLQGSAEWLTDCVPLSALIEKLHLVNMVCNQSTRDELIPAFEANLVYLCRKDDHNNDPIKCYGIGVVRATDLKKLYLLPAMSYDYLKEVNCLALGEMPLPSSLFTNQGPKVRKMAAFLYNTVNARTSKSIKQIFHRPSQFLSGKQKIVQ
ncbi:PREDICTED: polynucleotide 5'-hydroxyl-kinase NOL9 [Rhagoletis zephyria]|uniref:polynucleotide 5'-hydroxyl-kinase NOL9 n=1 Tax=Rhagoletis zephyria TaxID=28612 RepID=UPI0008117303|nr:PREDICTED: polynucleotide 5'-hydroxyl-kinase NOL9 [Rhagoletis zephyria]